MEDTYVPEPSMVQVVLCELKKIPEAILNEVSGDTDEIEMMEMAIARALGVVERFMDITYTETDLVPPPEHTGPDIQLLKVSYTETVEDLAGKYWKEVCN